MTTILKKEYKCYLTHLQKFTAEHLHQFVLIKGDRVAGFYTSYSDALKAGLSDFGNVAFFIKEVELKEEIHLSSERTRF